MNVEGWRGLFKRQRESKMADRRVVSLGLDPSSVGVSFLMKSLGVRGARRMSFPRMEF